MRSAAKFESEFKLLFIILFFIFLLFCRSLVSVLSRVFFFFYTFQFSFRVTESECLAFIKFQSQFYFGSFFKIKTQ